MHLIVAQVDLFTVYEIVLNLACVPFTVHSYDLETESRQTGLFSSMDISVGDGIHSWRMIFSADCLCQRQGYGVVA